MRMRNLSQIAGCDLVRCAHWLGKSEQLDGWLVCEESEDSDVVQASPQLASSLWACVLLHFPIEGADLLGADQLLGKKQEPVSTVKMQLAVLWVTTAWALLKRIGTFYVNRLDSRKCISKPVRRIQFLRGISLNPVCFSERDHPVWDSGLPRSWLPS